MATVGTGLDDSGSHPPPRVAAGAQQVSAGATFRVLRRNLPELNVRIGRLARRAERLGTAPLALREVGEDDGEHALVVLEGEPPALGGWTLAAVVDHRGGAPRLRVASSAAPALDPRRFREPRCDHCRLRRRRVETFVVWHAATQRLRQVGTGCLRDFLGGHDPERLCRQAEYVLLARESLAAAAAYGSSRSARPTGSRSRRSPRTRRWCCARRAGCRVSARERPGRPASADAALRSLQEHAERTAARRRGRRHCRASVGARAARRQAEAVGVRARREPRGKRRPPAHRRANAGWCAR